MKRKWRKVFLAVGVFALLLVLAGCKGKPLPDGMEEDTLLESGQAIVEQLIAQEYQTVYDEFRNDIQNGLTIEDIKNLVEEAVQEAGEFQKVSDTLATGSTQGEPHGIAVIYCKYSRDDVMFRVAFDTEMNLIGLDIRKQ